MPKITKINSIKPPSIANDSSKTWKVTPYAKPKPLSTSVKNSLSVYAEKLKLSYFLNQAYSDYLGQSSFPPVL